MESPQLIDNRVVTAQYTRSGARRAGDDYQDIIALTLLVEWLEHPERYKWMRLEADDAGFLDDIVAMRADDGVVAKQVKFSTHPNDAEDPYSWDDFLAERVSSKGKALQSLLSKWGGSFRELKNTHTTVEASLVSNRRPGDDLNRSFSAPGIVDLERIADPTVRTTVVTQLGGEQSARDFLASFRFDLDQPGLGTLEAATSRRFFNLHGEDRGWKSLKDEVRRWVRERNAPSPDGRITLVALQNAAEWQRLETLPEEFSIPEDFVIPDDQFHANLLRYISTSTTGCVVLTGPPGIGKSTYIRTYLINGD